MKKVYVFLCIIIFVLIFSIIQILGEPVGDTNSSGEINIIDALLIAQYYVEEEEPMDFDEGAADVNEDKSINILDALLVAQYYVEIIDTLPYITSRPTNTIPTSINQTTIPPESTPPIFTTSPTSVDDSMGTKMADTIINRSPNGYGSWNYETGTVLRGFQLLYESTGEERFYEYVKTTVDNVVQSSGSISGYSMSEYNLDQIKEGSLILYLYEKTNDQKYKQAADTLRDQLTRQPRTNSGGFWHKNKYPNQMWLDGLYMAEPFLAQYGSIFEGSSAYDEVVKQLTLMEKQARDNETGLLYHGWDESGSSSWADPVSNCSPVFWGRAIGWYSMALVDALDYIPESNIEQREELLLILNRLANAIKNNQDSNGVWWQVIDRANDSQNWAESSCTGMFVYSLAKAARLGYIDSDYVSVAKAGWEGLNNRFISESINGSLSLSDTCTGTGVGGSYNFYVTRSRNTNDPKGLGPYLMAAAEIEFLTE